MKKLALLFFCVMICFNSSACSLFRDTDTGSLDTEENISTEPSPEEKRFYEYAKQYSAIAFHTFYDDALELKFTSEILKKYKNAIIADYYLVFDDIISDENGNYVGLCDTNYYYIRDEFYNRIIKNDGILDGVVMSLRNITPIYQPSYINGESEIDVYSYDDEDFYGNADVNADISYSLFYKYEFDIIDVYLCVRT